MSKPSFLGNGVAVYFYLPLLLCAAGYIVLMAAVFPLLSNALSSLGLFTSDGAFGTLKTQTIFEQKDYSALNVEIVYEKDIVMPTYGTHYARLTIPSLSVAVDLYYGDSSAVLKKGVGQYIGSSLPGYGRPLLVGGHNNGAFGGLQHVKTGDIVTIATNYGIYSYRVTGVKIADCFDKSAYNLQQEKEQLILYTCYPFNTLGLTDKRFFVYADKVSGPRIVSEPLE